jgi:hypothetical protein
MLIVLSALMWLLCGAVLPRLIAGILIAAESPAWVSIVGVVITAVAGILGIFFTQAATRKGEQDVAFAKAASSLGDGEKRVRVTGIATIAQMAMADGQRTSYYEAAVETLCSYVRFERDMWCRDAVFDVLTHLNAIGAPSARRLLLNLRADLIRQIAEYAARRDLEIASESVELLKTAPEAEEILADIMSRNETDFARQLRFAQAFPSNEAVIDLAWNIRLAARDLKRTKMNR